ncbi:hypothetical protein B0H66DRAFT_536860 [Apodospora peruviana]|uniref:Uncharacterized protein n=1 Tax=Apodospora peruviana TaxID=516989 RepID=A0AAE0HVZ5_9PEZI|nr:hypothetical protein B0H66DRAFT_536860 [Apodospora peruviana]
MDPPNHTSSDALDVADPGNRDDDYDDDDNYGPTINYLPHDDHQDHIVIEEEEYFVDFLADTVREPGDCRTNAELYNDTTTREWMCMLASLVGGGRHQRQQQDPDGSHAMGLLDLLQVRSDAQINALSDPGSQPECLIPLFTDPYGRIYQVEAGLGGCAFPRTMLPKIFCPSFKPPPWDEDGVAGCGDTLFRLRTRVPYEPSSASSDNRIQEFPKLGMTLGMLLVTSVGRHPQYFQDGKPRTEVTDYEVVIGVSDEADGGDNDPLPVWIVAPRQRLEYRASGRHAAYPWPSVPIFRNGMDDGGGAGYDVACILPSVQRLGIRPSDTDGTARGDGLAPPDFEETCELVRRTRAVVDPSAVVGYFP